MTGRGMRPSGCLDVEGLIFVNKDFVRSYVVKKAPAADRQYPVLLHHSSLCLEAVGPEVIVYMKATSR
jgi:hypothetical protein